MLNRPATFTNPSKCSPSSARSSTTNSRHGAKSRGAVVASGSGRELGDLQKLGLNQLQTSLRVALTAEDYSKAAQIKQRLSEVLHSLLLCLAAGQPTQPPAPDSQLCCSALGSASALTSFSYAARQSPWRVQSRGCLLP